MKSISTGVVLLLGISLAANAWWGVRWARAGAVADEQRSGHSTEATTGRGPRAEPDAPLPAQPFAWSVSGASETELRALAAQLRAAGFPARVIAMIVQNRLQERVYAAQAELPFWQLIRPGKAARALKRAADAELARLQVEVLGREGTAVALLPPVFRALAFPDLDDEKLGAVLQIRSDYRQMEEELRADSPYSGPDGMHRRQEQRRLLEAEKNADLAAVLGAEKFLEMHLRDSPTALRVMNLLRDVTVSEAEYRQLYQLQEKYGAETTRTASTLEEGAARFLAQTEEHEALRAVLTDERYYTYLRALDPNFARVAQFTDQHPEITAESAYRLSRLRLEMEVAQAKLSAGSAQGVAGASERQKVTAAFNERLEALLGTETAASYRNHISGRDFRTNSRPRLTPQSLVPKPPGG